MLHHFFDNTYLINLDSRQDRLDKSIQACGVLGLEFERFSATPGSNVKDFNEYDGEYAQRIRWNKNAAGLVVTTMNIISDAIDKGYESILIMEDDIEFRQSEQLKEIVETGMKSLPKDWEMLYLGSIHHEPFEVIGPYMARVKSANTCHCYAIHSRVYELILKILSPVAFPIDSSYRMLIHRRGNSYCLVPNVAYQLAGHSDLEGAFIDNQYIREF